MADSMEGKVGVVTGAGRGVGLGIAQEFIAAGAKVVITDVDKTLIDDAVESLGSSASGFQADVTRLSDMEALYEEVANRHGRLDAVVANAGVGDSAPFGKITEQQFDFIFGVNTKGVLFTAQAALPTLSRGGTIVIIGSTASIQPPVGMSLYGGSKAAIRNFVRVWIQELKEQAIRINILSPGAIDTPSLRIALEGASGADHVDRIVAEMGQGNPSGRLGAAQEIGRAAVFLSSDQSSFVNGVELFVDGGMAQVG
jgi:NAD(P)-dependent dehydrogenase (short-subunit alcohol dehydrogenase family)